jgi:hypothetical protein
MARMLDHAVTDVSVAYRQIGLFDRDLYEGLGPPNPDEGSWVRSGTASVLLLLGEDYGPSRLTLELWDTQPSPPDHADWSISEVIDLELPSGWLCVEMIAPGSLRDVFSVGGPGHYRDQFGWRGNPGRLDPDSEDPEALLLAQFWAYGIGHVT